MPAAAGSREAVSTPCERTLAGDHVCREILKRETVQRTSDFMNTHERRVRTPGTFSPLQRPPSTVCPAPRQVFYFAPGTMLPSLYLHVQGADWPYKPARMSAREIFWDSSGLRPANIRPDTDARANSCGVFSAWIQCRLLQSVWHCFKSVKGWRLHSRAAVEVLDCADGHERREHGDPHPARLVGRPPERARGPLQKLLLIPVLSLHSPVQMSGVWPHPLVG